MDTEASRRDAQNRVGVHVGQADGFGGSFKATAGSSVLDAGQVLAWSARTEFLEARRASQRVLLHLLSQVDSKTICSP